MATLYKKTNFNITLFLLLFFSLFNIKIRGIPVITTHILYGGIGAIIFIIYFPSILKKRISNTFKRHIFIFIFLLMIILLSLLIHLSTDLSFIKLFVFNNTVSLFIAYVLCKYVEIKKISKREFLRYFVIVYFVQALFTLYFFINKEVCKMIYSYIDMGERINACIEDLIAYRAFGLSFGFDMGTADMTVGLIFSLFLYLTEPKSYNRWFFVFFICAISGILMARTMFIGILITVLFILFFPKEKGNRKISFFCKLLLLIICLTTVVLIFIDSKEFMRTIWWLTDIFIQLFSKKGLTSGSLYELTKGDFVFCPEIDTLIIGEGVYDMNLVSRYTDVGHIRLLMYFGIFGYLTYLVYLLSRVNLFLGKRKNSQEKYTCVFLFIFQFIFLWKIFYTISSFPILMLTGVLCWQNENSEVNGDQYRNDHIQWFEIS